MMSTATSDGSSSAASGECSNSAVSGTGASSSRISGLKRLADIRRAEHERRQRIDAQRFAMTHQPINRHKACCDEGDERGFGESFPIRASPSPAAEVTSFARQRLLRLGKKHASFVDKKQTSHDSRSSESSGSASMPLHLSAPKDGTRDEGMGQYYLLARSMSTSKSHHQVSNADSLASTAPIVSDDECSSEQSYCTPSDVHGTHGLQSSIDHGPARNTEDGSSFFAAFCESQVLITRLEDEQIQRKKEAEGIRLHQQVSRQRRRRILIQFSKLIVLCATIFVLRKLAINFHENTRLYVLGRVGHVRTMILGTADSLHDRQREMVASAKQKIYIKSLSVESRIVKAKAIPSEAYRKLTGTDLVSFLVDGYFRGLQFYYNALDLVECFSLEVQSYYTALLVWYTSEPEPSSTWQNSDSAEQHIAFAENAPQIAKSVVTLPILSDEYVWNMTVADESSVERSVVGGLGTTVDMFWRQSMRKPFVKQEVPMMVRHLHRHMHSVPCQDSLCGTDIASPSSFTGSTAKHLKRLRISVPRLQSVLLPTELDGNLVASLIVQKSKPPTQAGSRSLSHPSADDKRKYYKSSLSIVDVREDVFSDVKIADMAIQYLDNLWKRRRKRLNKRP